MAIRANPCPKVAIRTCRLLLHNHDLECTCTYRLKLLYARVNIVIIKLIPFIVRVNVPNKPNINASKTVMFLVLKLHTFYPGP